MSDFPIRLDKYRLTDGRTIVVVRDDLIPGGSKQAALMTVLPLLGYREYCFTSPVYGYAQKALALACRDLGLRASIFCAKRRVLAPLTQQAKDAGATIIEVPAGRLSVLRARARTYCSERGAFLFPMGFAVPAMLEQFTKRAQAVPYLSQEVWATAGSGALSRALQGAWPAATHYAVRIGFPPDVGRATLLDAPERFEEPAAGEQPPFPSCANYDAKAWRFICLHASDGALFWNVGA